MFRVIVFAGLASAVAGTQFVLFSHSAPAAQIFQGLGFLFVSLGLPVAYVASIVALITVAKAHRPLFIASALVCTLWAALMLSIDFSFPRVSWF